MNRVERTLAWIGLGVLNGVAAGTIVAILFGWTTVGCNADGIEAVNDALPFGAILGSMLGVIGGAVCEARGMRMRPFVLSGATAFILGFCLYGTHGMSSALHDAHIKADERRPKPEGDKAPEPPPAKKEERR